MKKQFFEDFLVGDRFETSSYTLTVDEVIAFGRQFDPQPFHIDEERAKDGPFGRLIASGWQTTAIGMRLWVSAGIFPESGGLGLGVDELRWLAPVFPGDTLRVSGEVLDSSPSPRKIRGRLRIRMMTFNQNNEMVLSQIAIVAINHRPELG